MQVMEFVSRGKRLVECQTISLPVGDGVDIKKVRQVGYKKMSVCGEWRLFLKGVGKLDVRQALCVRVMASVSGGGM